MFKDMTSFDWCSFAVRMAEQICSFSFIAKETEPQRGEMTGPSPL